MYGSCVCDPFSTLAHALAKVPALTLAITMIVCGYVVMQVTPDNPCDDGVVKQVVVAGETLDVCFTRIDP